MKEGSLPQRGQWGDLKKYDFNRPKDLDLEKTHIPITLSYSSSFASIGLNSSLISIVAQEC